MKLGDIIIVGERPAIVVKVNDDSTVNLQVFNDGNSVTYIANYVIPEEIEGSEVT